jgi:hypothetical protein
VGDNAHTREKGEAPLEWPGGYVCYPKAFPALVTLSTTDVSHQDPSWHCDQLNVVELLHEGEQLTFRIAEVLRWLELG